MFIEKLAMRKDIKVLIRNKVTWIVFIIVLLIVTVEKPELSWEMAHNVLNNAFEVFKLSAAIITGNYY